MKVTELIELLDKEENKYGASGKERELTISINGDFVGSLESAKLDGWGDGLITDVNLELQVSGIDYHDKKIRNKAIDDLICKIEEHKTKGYVTGITHNPFEFGACQMADDIVKIAEQLKAGGIDV